jgi:hypothetical protein
LARKVQADGGLDLWGSNDPLAVAVSIAADTTIDAEDAQRELYAYDEAAPGGML